MMISLGLGGSWWFKKNDIEVRVSRLGLLGDSPRSSQTEGRYNGWGFHGALNQRRVNPAYLEYLNLFLPHELSRRILAVPVHLKHT